MNFYLCSVYFFKVKGQCEFRTPPEDKIRVMVRSSALKAPISTRLIPSAQMTSSKVLGEITKVLQSNEEIPKISQGTGLFQRHSIKKVCSNNYE